MSKQSEGEMSKHYRVIYKGNTMVALEMPRKGEAGEWIPGAWTDPDEHVYMVTDEPKHDVYGDDSVVCEVECDDECAKQYGLTEMAYSRVRLTRVIDDPNELFALGIITTDRTVSDGYWVAIGHCKVACLGSAEVIAYDDTICHVGNDAWAYSFDRAKICAIAT